MITIKTLPFPEAQQKINKYSDSKYLEVIADSESDLVELTIEDTPSNSACAGLNKSQLDDLILALVNARTSMKS